MPLRAHAFGVMVRVGMRWRFGRAADAAAFRRVVDREPFSQPAGVAFAPGSVGGIAGEWARPVGMRGALPRLLYVHGGGFVAGSARMYRSITGALATEGLAVFAPDYRLAPEHPFPCGLDDVVAAWRALSAEGQAGIAGDSAGGNLALGAMIVAREHGLPLPSAAALFSPVTHLSGRGTSHRENRLRDAMFNPSALACLRPAYGADPADPRASPVEADLAGLPPMLIHAAEREMLRDDSVLFAQRARGMGVAVDLSIWPVVPHCWQFAAPFLPEARRSLGEAAVFLKAALEPKVAREAAA